MRKTTVLFATQMGASQELAGRAADDLESAGIEAFDVNMADFSIDDLKSEEDLFVIASTWGDGDPPDECEDFFHALKESAPLHLENVRFCVLALGDTSYEMFCQFGKNLDEELERHGAQRILDRVDCDLDEQEQYPIWIEKIQTLVKNEMAAKS
ncbi:MAG: flavodoxin domain-containing protein [Verrucomicrobiota bacterium]